MAKYKRYIKRKPNRNSEYYFKKIITPELIEKIFIDAVLMFLSKLFNIEEETSL